MLTYVLTALAAVAAVLFLLGRGGRSRPRRSAALTQPDTRPYAAVSIQPATVACNAAQRVAGRRYLRTEAPAVPLKNCDGRRCGCRLLTHRDRRQGGTDRRLGVGLQSELYLTAGNRDRRVRRGRRRSDGLPA